MESDGRKYTICVDGSNRVITRNRRFVRLDTINSENFDQVELPCYTPDTAFSEPYDKNDNSVEPTLSSPQPSAANHSNSEQAHSTVPLSTTHPRDILPSVPQSQSSTPQQQHVAVPRMLTRLFPFNNTGLKES